MAHYSLSSSPQKIPPIISNIEYCKIQNAIQLGVKEKI